MTLESELAIETLCIMLLQDPVPQVRCSAALALGKLKQVKPTIAQALCYAALTDEDPAVRGQCALSIAQLHRQFQAFDQSNAPSQWSFTQMSPNAEPLSVFISYAHADEDLKDELVIHLATLKRQGKIKAWQDRDIEAGTEWDQEIKGQLEAAEIILLLITPRFLASDYCFDLEMQGAIDRHNAGTARVIPIVLRPCDWQGTPFSKLQVLPKDAKPVTTWSNKDEAFLDVVKGIRRAVESLQAKKSQR